MTFKKDSKNFLKSLKILYFLAEIGAEYFIVCPGSRSAPLAIAAGELFKRGKIKLFNCIDERSAGFHALGISTALGKLTVVITTSGTAVANLLPSSVEADKSCQKIIFLTADRPLRLKNCGSNQTVNQEDFLISSCKTSYTTNLDGLHLAEDYEIDDLMNRIFERNNLSTGPIHLNIPFEKPLDISRENIKKVFEIFDFQGIKNKIKCWEIQEINNENMNPNNIFQEINLSDPGIIIVGPYRGSSNDLSKFNFSLRKLQKMTGWPVFADPVSGIDADLRGLIEYWEFIISNDSFFIKCDQLLRIGPISSSLYLYEFLNKFEGKQFLIKENDSRDLDPTRKSIQYEFGLNAFVNTLIKRKSNYIQKRPLSKLACSMISEGERIKQFLNANLSIGDQITECSLAYLVPKIWPSNFPIMLSASSPIRDWLTYSGSDLFLRRCFSFRGASGIDGTLSTSLGIARVTNNLLLVTGDLAFLHDINGWLIEKSNEVKLTVLLIDNNGGNIFNKLYKNTLSKSDLDKLFIMSKNINWQKLAETYDIPYQCVCNLSKLKQAFEWSFNIQKSAIIKVNIDVDYEATQRKDILNYVHQKK